MQRKALVMVVGLFLVSAGLGAWLLVGNPRPAEASAVRQETRRALTIDEFALLNQAGPLWLTGIDLKQTNLHAVKLPQAVLSSANLSGADLSYTDLSPATLRDADLKSAKYNASTTWPQDFDPAAAGAVLGDQ